MHDPNISSYSGQTETETVHFSKKTICFYFFAYSILTGFMIFRILHGVDYTDESWHVAEPYLVSQGKIPYVNNWSQAPGFTIPLAFAYYIYSSIAGTAGIYMFSRLLYLFWSISVGLIVIFLVHRYISEDLPLIWYMPFFLIQYKLFNIDYNTIGTVYLPLITALVLIMVKEERLSFPAGFICGIIGARAFIGSPYIIVPCIIMLILLFSKGRISAVRNIMAGVLFFALLAICWCCYRSSVPGFISGVSSWLNTLGYVRISRRQSYLESVVYMLDFLEPFTVYAILALCSFFFFKSRKPDLREKDDSLYSVLLLITAVFLFIGLHFLAGGIINKFTLINFTKFSWFESFALLLIDKRDVKARILVFVSVVFFSVYLTSSAFNIYGFGSREYWLIAPCVMSFITLLILILHFYAPVASYRVFCLIIFISVVLLYNLSIHFVYRDDAFKLLNTKVETGVWKGCYTTAQRSSDIQALEKAIRNFTEEQEKIMFLDWTSFGYLMSDGIACTCTALDPSSHTYDRNNPSEIFTYYSQEKTVPDKIIYIDYGRDEFLSIEEPTWIFNDFVLTFYKKTNSYTNSTFRVLVYELEDKYNALRYAEDYLRHH